MNQKLFTQLVETLIEKGFTLSSCESLTAGLFSASVASVPGASATLLGGVVSYSAAIKEKVVNVPKDVVEEYGVVSEECAAAMAEGVQNLMDSDLSVSCTGNAGPSALEGKPVGMVCFGFADGCSTETLTVQFGVMERNALREAVCEKMAEELLKRL